MDGKKKKLLVHRKGATRAFPPHHPLVPKAYQDTGQPVIIGGTMGTCSYVLTGTEVSGSPRSVLLLSGRAYLQVCIPGGSCCYGSHSSDPCKFANLVTWQERITSKELHVLCHLFWAQSFAFLYLFNPSDSSNMLPELPKPSRACTLSRLGGGGWVSSHLLWVLTATWLFAI